MPYKDKEKQKEFQRLRLQENRSNFFKDKFCIVCGDTDNLQLDHIDTSQKVSHRIWGWSEARRIEELSKCQVLCERHHIDKSSNEHSGHDAYMHGTQSMYFNHKCRCEICLVWYNDVRKPYNAEWMRNNRRPL